MKIIALANVLLYVALSIGIGALTYVHDRSLAVWVAPYDIATDAFMCGVTGGFIVWIWVLTVAVVSAAVAALVSKG